jgi:hypothetical protein
MEDHASWAALWGPSGLYRARHDLPLVRSLDPKKWSLEHLARQKIPGANLEKLGLVHKPMKDMPR